MAITAEAMESLGAYLAGRGLCVRHSDALLDGNIVGRLSLDYV
jgi:hypothetical protein